MRYLIMVPGEVEYDLLTALLIDIPEDTVTIISKSPGGELDRMVTPWDHRELEEPRFEVGERLYQIRGVDGAWNWIPSGLA